MIQNRTIYAQDKRSLNMIPGPALKKILLSISVRTGMSEEVIFDLLATGWVYTETIEGVSWNKKTV